MSVINRMLQELESRHEQPQDRLPGIVRAVPPARASYRRFLPLALLSIGATLLGGFGFWGWQSYWVPPVVTVAPAPPAVSAAAAAPEQVWPQPLQAPTETLVSEMALATPPASQPSATGPASKSVVPAAATNPMPPPKPEILRAVESQPNVPGVLKAAPNSAPETPATAGIKQVSPAQRADQAYREALALRAQGRATEAQSLLEDALKLDPRHAGARQALLGMLVDARRYAQAETVLQDGLALNSASPKHAAPLAMALARLQMERGEQDAALATLERHASGAQDNADYQAFQAALLQRAERHAEAVAHYQAALRAQPNRAVWWMGLGISLQAEKRAADATQAFSRARATPGLSPELQSFVEQRLKQLQ